MLKSLQLLGLQMPKDPNWFEKTIFTHLTCGQTPAPTLDGMNANAFSLVAEVISALKKV